MINIFRWRAQKIERRPRVPGRWAEAGSRGQLLSPTVPTPCPLFTLPRLDKKNRVLFSLIDYSSTHEGRPNDQGEWLPSLYCFSLEKWQTGFWAARLGPVGRTGTHSSCACCLSTTVSTISSAKHLLQKYIARINSYYLRIIC